MVRYKCTEQVRSSVGERPVYARMVVGSSPTAPIFEIGVPMESRLLERESERVLKYLDHRDEEILREYIEYRLAREPGVQQAKKDALASRKDFVDGLTTSLRVLIGLGLVVSLVLWLWSAFDRRASENELRAQISVDVAERLGKQAADNERRLQAVKNIVCPRVPIPTEQVDD
jgi:hypothetical protein